MSNKPTTLQHLKSTAMRSNILAAEVAQATADAIEELGGQKADLGAWHTVTLPAASWAANTDEETLAAGYAFCCEAALAGIAAKDSAESVLHAGSIAAARAATLCPTTDVLDGKIRYYAVTQPGAAIILQVRPIVGAPAS